MAYLEAEVDRLTADWVDARDHTKGIICRETCNFHGRSDAYWEQIPNNNSASFRSDGELRGVKFVPPIRPEWTRVYSL